LCRKNKKKFFNVVEITLLKINQFIKINIFFVAVEGLSFK